MYNRLKKWPAMVLAILMTMGFVGCGDDDASTATNTTGQQNEDNNSGDNGNDDSNNGNPTTEDIDLAVIANKFYNSDAVTVAVSDDFVTITTTNEPDHKSMYYPVDHALYEAYNEPNNPRFRKNPNNIVAQNISFRLPRHPSEATNKQTTGLGPMGVAINGVVLFNQNAAPGDDILDELHTFDQYEGHPQQRGTYHYHTEPVFLTQTKSDSALIGVLLDGFPVYGPVENGKTIANSDLDDYHGHSHATADFPMGIYHYHITDDLPWINGSGYFGNVGTLTQ